MEPGNPVKGKNKKLLVVGITGVFGSGKTTVTEIFSTGGIPSFSLDNMVHELYKKKEIIGGLASIFGKQAVRDGIPDRKVISEKAFSDPLLRKKLEDLIHPLVFERCRQIIFDWKRKGGIIVFEVPLLFETKSDSFFDKIVVVSASPREILSRLKRKFTAKDIKKRLANQIPLKEKEKKATYVVCNSGSIDETTAQVKKLIGELQKALTG